MLYLLGLVILVAGLLLSVILHELGHLSVAKMFKVLVPECWAGFGPVLWSKQLGDTRYGLKAWPLGGYVRILGMYPPAPAGTRTRTRVGKVTLAEQAREDSAQEMEKAAAAGLRGYALWQVSPWKKAAVIAAGPVVNLILAFVFTAWVVVGYGSQVTTTTVAEVNADPKVSSTAAYEAGIQAGDQILSWDGQRVTSWEQLRSLVADSDAQLVQVQVERDGQTLTLEVTAQNVESSDGSSSLALGVTSQVERVHGTWGEAVIATGQQVSLSLQAIWNLPANLWHTVESLFTGEERSSDSVVSVVGVARVAGEISSTATESQDLTWVDRVAMLCSLLAALNVALFVFNLIPLPPLDGGHFVAAVWGGLKNLWARLLRRPHPHPVDAAKAVPLASVVFVLLIAISLVLVVADLVDPVTLFS